MKKVDFVFFDAGGGHRSAANALKAVIEQQQRPWQVRLVNLQELLDSLDILRRVTGIRMQDIYNNLLASGWTWGSEYLLPPMHGLIRVYHHAQTQMLADFWRKDAPDLVVSVVPNFNRAFHHAIQKVNPAIPLATIMTDFADYPPNFWLEEQDQYVICGTERAYQQALGMKYNPDKVFQVSGMILRPPFYQSFTHDRAEERMKLGLQPDLPTGIVLFGGQGSRVMVSIADRLKNSNLPTQLIFICGKNQRLKVRLEAMKGRMPFHVVGYTQEVPHYMSLSDYMIGKPGPGSISEALAMKLPVILERNSWTLPQERYNTEWVQQKKVGTVLGNFLEIHKSLAQLLKDGGLEKFKKNVSALSNRAVFEIPDILAGILKKHS